MVLAFYRYSYTRVTRGVAFEFRFRDAEHRTFWDHGFFYGSVVATLAQRVILGAFFHGFPGGGGGFGGPGFGLLTPVSILTGNSIVPRYTLPLGRSLVP